jgi:hypothetical protein
MKDLSSLSKEGFFNYRKRKNLYKIDKDILAFFASSSSFRAALSTAA